MAHEGASGDRLAVPAQQQELAERRREGLGGVAQDFGSGAARPAVGAVAAVILGDEAFEQNLGLRGNGDERMIRSGMDDSDIFC